MRINNIELLYMTDNESRATNFRNNFVPRAYNKPWPRFAVSRDEKNKKHKRRRGPNPVKKLKADLEKMKKRINKEKKQNGGRRKTRKHKKRRKTRKYKKRKRRKTKRRR